MKVFEFISKFKKSTKILLMIGIIMWALVIVMTISVYGNDMLIYINNNVIYDDNMQLVMSSEDKEKDFDYICNVLTTSMPSLDMFSDRYEISFNDNVEKYKQLLADTDDNFEYYCTLSGIFSDIPSAHTYMLYPSCYDYSIANGYNSHNVSAIWNINSYTNYWEKYIQKVCKEKYKDDFFCFQYLNSCGKYYLNNSMGISAYTDKYYGSYIKEINGEDVDSFIINNLFYSSIAYDELNDKPYRSDIVFSGESEYGREINVTLCLPDGSLAEEKLYSSCSDEVIALYGMSYDEKYIYNASDSPFYIYSDNDITYIRILSLDYGFGSKIKDSLLSIDSNNIIIDLRGNTGGNPYNFQEYLYPALFDSDFEVSKIYYIPVSPQNNRSIFKTNIIFDIYSRFKYPKNYIDSNEKITYEYDIVMEEDKFSFAGARENDASIYILCGRSTASATDGFVSFLKDKTDTVIIGNETKGEGRGSSYVMCGLPKSKLVFSYYPSLSYNSDGSCNSVYGTLPDYDIPEYSSEQFLKRNEIISEYGMDYAYEYEQLLKWDNVLIKTLEMIKEEENDQRNNTPNE